MTDKDTADAIAALAHRLRERDSTIRDGEDVPDAEVFANEFMLALRERGGWRPTPAKVIPWGTVTPGTKPALRPETLDMRAALAADLEAKAAAARVTKTSARGDDGTAA